MNYVTLYIKHAHKDHKVFHFGYEKTIPFFFELHSYNVCNKTSTKENNKAVMV